jgi:TfoX/Sxy family transcriptional regulator of competence genes
MDATALFARHLPVDPRLALRKMFGCPCAFAAGNMFLGVHAGTLFLRLNPEDRARLIAEHGARRFDPLGGRPMREYVVLPDPILRDDAALAHWIARGFAYASALAPPPRPQRR